MAKRTKEHQPVAEIGDETPTESSGESGQSALLPLPKPRLSQLPPQEFFEYWRSIPENLREDRVIVYPYRLLPKIDVFQPLSEEDLELIRLKKKPPPPKNIGKLVEPLNPEHWALELAKRWGAGDYLLRLNDTHPSVKRTVCMTASEGEQPLRDWSNFPPLLNLDQVVLTEKSNQPYIRWAHLNGIYFPGEPEFQAREEGSDVANVEAVNKLTDTVVKLSEDRARDKPASDFSSTAGAKTLEVMASAATAGQKIITDAITTAQSMAATAADPLGQAGKVIEMVQKMMPAPVPPSVPVASGPSAFMEAFTLFKELLAIQNATNERMHQDMAARLKSTEDSLREMTSKAMAAANPSPSKAGQFGILDDILSVKEKLDRLTGTGGPDNGLPAWAPFALRGAEMIINGAQNIVHNVAAMKGIQNLAPPVPVSAEEVEQLPEAPSNETTGVPEVNTEDMMYKMYARQIHRPLVEALTAGEPGRKLGGRIVVQAGEPVYRFLVGLGPQGVIGLLQKAPEVWADVVRFGSRAEAFIVEFLRPDLVMPEADAMRTMMQEPVGTTAGVPRRPPGRTVLGPDGRPIRVMEPTVPIPSAPLSPGGPVT